MVEVERVLWRLSCSNPLLKQGYLKQPRTLSGQIFNILMDGDYTTSLGNLYLCIVTLKKCLEVFPDVQRKPPVLQLVPVVSGPVTEHHGKETASVVFAS